MKTLTMQDVAVMSVQYVQHTFDYYLKSMQKCGLKNIDMWGGSPHFCRLDYATSQAVARAIAELRYKIEDLGMKIVIYTPETLGYPFSYSNPQQALRDRTIDFMYASMEDALLMGTNKVFLNTGCHPRDLDREKGWDRTVKSISMLCQRAESLGVTLVLEQLQPYESNLLLSKKDMERMLNDVNSKSLSVCVDVVAMEVAGDSLNDFFSCFGDKIEWIHYSDSHHEILGAGEYGKEKLVEYVRILERNNYKGYLDLEINDSIYWENPHSSIAQSAEFLRTFLPEK